jgi:diguanylate cyclase (GGDEF)-like protein
VAELKPRGGVSVQKVRNLIRKAAEHLADSQIAAVSLSTRFQAAHDADFCCALAVLGVNNLQSTEKGHHRDTLDSAAKELGLKGDTAAPISTLVQTRCRTLVTDNLATAPLHSAARSLQIELTDSMSGREARLVEGFLRILRNQIALLDYGERDTLTGLLNRKTFESRFSTLCSELPEGAPSTSDQQSWLGILDIDHFKLINDEYGHVVGDEVLLLISQIMQRALRWGDRLFRFGGEEFVVILEHTTAAAAQTVFERIRMAVAGHCFPPGCQCHRKPGLQRAAASGCSRDLRGARR